MFEREVLEENALQAICACRYYDLADCLSETSNAELLAIIEGRNRCHNCR